MAEKKTEWKVVEIPGNFGKIFNRYIRLTKNGDKVNIPVLCGSPSTFVNVILSPGETIDLISALQDVLSNLKKGVVTPS